MKKRLRCFLKQEASQWVAVCVDINLAVQKDSREDAKRALEDMIVSYVNDAVSVDSLHMDALLSRKSPLSIMLEYYMVVFLSWFRVIECCPCVFSAMWYNAYYRIVI